MSKTTSLTSISTEMDVSKSTKRLTYSLGSIDDPGDHSVGQLPMICTPRWNRGHFDFTTIDYNEDSGVCFTAGFHVTGDPETAWTSIAAGRAVSILLAARMFDSGVEEMYRTLTDLFEHYSEVEAEIENHRQLPAMVPAFIADQKASPAFDLND